jgi:hypothetical protein
LRFPLEKTFCPVQGLPIESTGRACWPLARKWYELRAFSVPASGVAVGSVPRVVAPLSSMLIV